MRHYRLRLAAVVLLVLVGMIVHVRHRRKMKTRPIPPMGSVVADAVAAERLKRVNSLWKAGWWNTAHLSLFCLDLLYPTITRTLLQLASCRDLGEAGSWMESDYNVRCYTTKYFSFVPLMAAGVVLFAVGVPAGFMFLCKHYKDLGKAGDIVVVRALGPVMILQRTFLD